MKAQEFQVSGELKVSIYGRNRNQKGYIYNFDVYINECKYFIIMSITNKNDPQKINYYTHIWDGSNYYQLERLNVPKDDTNIFTDYSVNIKTNNDIFEPTGTCAEYVWFAFASHCYLKSTKNNMLNPIWTLNDPTINNSDLWIDAVIKKYSDNLGLPYKIIYVGNGDIRCYDSTTGNPYIIKAPPPYDKAFIEAVYEVNKTSTELGYSIPIEFTFIKLSTPAAGELQYYQNVIFGYVKSIRKGSIPIVLPAGHNIRVVDWSRQSILIQSNETLVTPSSYNVISNKWPDEKDLMIARLDKENRMLRSAPTPDTTVQKKHITKKNPFLYIIGFVMLAPLAYVAYKKIKSK